MSSFHDSPATRGVCQSGVVTTRDSSSGEPFYVGRDPCDIADARQWLTTQLTPLGLDTEAIDELRLALTEATTNLLEHGEPRTKSELHLSVETDRVHLMIRDDSPPFEPGSPGDTDREGGFGLLLLHMLTDEVEIQPGDTGGSVLRLTKLRPVTN
jgi:serine/threonine-protein kinase RsbW